MKLNRSLGIKIAVLGVLLAASALVAVYAIPDPGTLIIRTVHIDTGVIVPNVQVTVRQVESDFPFPTYRDRTDVAGRLFVAVPPGLYRVTAQSAPGGGQLAGVSSRAEVPVLMLVKKKP